MLSRYPQLAGWFDIDRRQAVFLLPAPGRPALAWPWQAHLSALSTERQAGGLEEMDGAAERDYPTDQGAGMLTALVHLDGQRHVLLLVIHHLVVDGWSTPCCCATCSPPTATM